MPTRTMSDFDKTAMDKAQIEDVFIEEKPQGDAGLALMPPSLAALSDAEFANLGRKATVKMDALIMPCLVIMYIMNYLDRQNIAAAKLADIDKDLHLSDVQYQTCISLLFVGYSESPSQRVSASNLANLFHQSSCRFPPTSLLVRSSIQASISARLWLFGA
jgi:hypothetical protein